MKRHTKILFYKIDAIRMMRYRYHISEVDSDDLLDARLLAKLKKR